MTIILVSHIILMIASISATSAMAFLAVMSRAVHQLLARASVVVTSAGIGCGILLLLDRPLDSKCAILFAYTLAFAAVYRFVTKRNQSLALESL